MIYKTFQKVSNVCQVLDKSKYHKTLTINGVTFTNNGDGTITANGTSTKDFAEYHILRIPKPPIGHKILVLPSTNLTIQNHIYIYAGNTNGVWIDDLGHGGRIITITEITSWLKKTYTTINISINVNKGWTMNNHIYKPQLFDLTEMYGAGHEPTTVEQFRQDFPDEMYDYSPRCFVTSYKTLLKVGNVCQLLDKSKYPATTTKAGVTFTNNGDGTITVNGTATSDIFYWVKRFIDNSLCLSHKYLVTGETSGLKFFMENRDENNKILTQVNYNMISALPSNTKRSTFECYIKQGKVCDNLVIKPQFFDLTEMYGAGNEPTTVEQFRQDFPEEMYDYKPYSIIPSYKKSLVCKTKNLFDISKLQAYTPETLPQGTAGVYNGNIIARARINSSVCESGKTLKELCPDLVAGERYTLSFETSAKSYVIYLRGANEYWYKNNSSVVTEAMLNSLVGFYANYPELTVATISNFQIELGDTATDYVPYGHL